MKKIRVITSALIAASMLVGAGYAAWNKTLTINHSVSVAQDVAVEFRSPVDPYLGPEGIIGSGQYDDVSYSYNATTANFSITGMHPGSYYWCNVNEQNVGSLPAVFDNAVVNISGTQSVVNNMTVDLNFYIYNSSGVHIDSLGYLQNVPLADLQATLNAYMTDLVLQPGDFVTTFVGDQAENYSTFRFSPNAGPDTMNGNVNFSITLNWKQ